MKYTNTTIFALDIDGCIMPPNRAEVDLSKLQKLKDYCHSIRKNTSYPQIVIYTGRSQEYVEFLSQVLGLTECPVEIPFVIENGTALYFPASKKMLNIISDKNIGAIHASMRLIKSRFPDHSFEPKQNIVTINPLADQSIDKLKEEIILLLKKEDLLNKVAITNSASSVDILPIGASKLSGFKYLVNNYLEANTKIIAIGDSYTDLDVLLHANTAYVPQNANDDLKNIVSSRHNTATLLPYQHIDAVIKMIEIETQLIC